MAAGSTFVGSIGTPAFLGGNDAPLIGERAATHGRIAMEGGDAHAAAKRALSVFEPSLPNPIKRRKP
jgi:hypothetical protein